MELDDRVVAGMAAQLAKRAEVLAGGAEPIGWKVGFNVPSVQEAFGIRQPVTGFMTTRSLVPAGEPHSLAGATTPMAEPEVAVHIGASVDAGCDREEAAAAIAALGPAIEIADVHPLTNDVERVVAMNAYHRAVSFGDPVSGVELDEVTARVTYNGQPLGDPDPTDTTLDPVAAVQLAAATIATGGERLRPGDRIITGSLVPPPVVSPGDELALDLGPLGSLALRFVS